MRLERARAVVTGGASGLGLAVAERLVELGARVVVLDLRAPVALPPGAAYVEADVGSEAATDRAMAEAVEVLGGLTLAVSLGRSVMRYPGAPSTVVPVCE
ncbi:MAG: SDR family NAD(P)-dependent oxidoreductase [Gammaproteobacteria bacterium]